MRFDLKIALLKTFGSQVKAARALEICESRLSYLINEHREPTLEERERLRAGLGADYFDKHEGPEAA